MDGQTNEGFRYPGIPEKNWWELRERLKITPSVKVSAQWLATELGMTESSARANVVPSLLTMGIIDSEGALAERGRRWRLDDSYPQVCDEILDLYPEGLRGTYRGSDLDKGQVANWIMAHTTVGSRGASKYAAVYVMLNKRTPQRSANTRQSGATSRNSQKPAGRATPSPKRSSKSVPAAASASSPSQSSARPGEILKPSEAFEAPARPRVSPAIHIDIQIHIPPDASAELIDQIFASMARQLTSL
jgi:hypothetical protein